MRPNSRMVTVSQQALAWHDANPHARELAETWQVRFASTIHADKRWATINRVSSWFKANDGYRSTDGFFGNDDPTPERVAWDLLGGDAGLQWALEILERGHDQEGDGVAAETIRIAEQEEQRALASEWTGPGGVEVPATEVEQLTEVLGTHGMILTELKDGQLKAVPASVDQYANAETFASFEGRRPEWQGTLTLEGTPTSDNRLIREGALTWRDLPITLQDQLLSQPGHDGAVAAGPITNIFRADGGRVQGEGFFDTGEDGQRAQRRMSEGTKQGVSVDLSEVEIFLPEDPDDILEILFGDALLEIISAKIAAATLVSIPAFEGARLTITGDVPQDQAALVAAGGFLPSSMTVRVTVPIEVAEVTSEALTASAGPTMFEWSAVSHLEDNVGTVGNPVDEAGLVASASGVTAPPRLAPPKQWFDQQKYSGMTAFTITDPGEGGLRRIHGHVAAWGSCHIGFSGKCVDVPRGLDYDSFQGPKVPNEVVCADGTRLKAGPVIMDTVHPNLRKQASDAYSFYADTGCMPAQVRAYEDEWGLQIQGWIMPGTTDEDLVKLNAVDLSPDWRPRATAAGGRGVVCMLAVPCSGFNLGLVASAGGVDEYEDTPIDELAIVATNWTPRLWAAAAAKIEVLERLDMPVPVGLVELASQHEHPAMSARKERVLARLSAEACDCGCSLKK